MAIAQSNSFLMNGVQLACFLKSFTPTAETEALDATVLCNTYKSFEFGYRTGMISAEGLFSADAVNADDIHDVFKAAYDAGTSNVVTASLGTVAVDAPAIMMDGPQLKYAIDTITGQLITVNAEFQATNGIAFGKWLANVQLNSGTTNGTSVDNTAGTTNGGVFHVHLHNNTASDCDFKVQHSTDNSSWSDLTGAAVNNLSAAHSSGSATVATGTTVSRYIRLVSVITGGDTTLVSAAFARR